MNTSSFRSLLLLLAITPLAAFAQDKTQPVIDAGKSRLTENQKAQENVDSVYEKSRSIVEEYQNLLKVTDGLEVYNRILGRQIDSQMAEIKSLNDSISNAAIIERQILPLLTRMLAGLDQFIQLDVPFSLEERKQRVKNLHKLVERSDLSNAEKTRRVFEAFQIENDYGNTIDTYKGKLDIADKTFDVDFLRIGRVALVYRTLGSDHYGYWDRTSQSWRSLTDSVYRRNIDKGIKMARQEMAPELITIPLVISQDSSR